MKTLIAYNNNKHDNYVASRILKYAIGENISSIKGINSIFGLNNINLEEYSKVILVGISLTPDSLNFYLPNLTIFSFNPYYAQSIKSNIQISNYSIVCLGYGKSYAYTKLHQLPSIVDMVMSNLNNYNYCYYDSNNDSTLDRFEIGNGLALDLIKTSDELEYGSKNKEDLKLAYAVLTQNLQLDITSLNDSIIIKTPSLLPVKLPKYSVLNFPQYQLSIALVDEDEDYRASRLLDVNVDVIITTKMSIAKNSVLKYLIVNYNPKVYASFQKFMKDYHLQPSKNISKVGYMLLNINWLTIFQTLHRE